MTSSEENKTEPNIQLAKELAAGLQSTSSLIQGLLQSIHDNSQTLGAFEGEISNLQGTVASLNRILQEGDGKASILTRVALLESQAEATAKKLETYIADQKKGADRSRRNSADMVKKQLEGKLKVKLSKIQLLAVIVPSFLAFIISILSFFLSK